jgi:hypothetical protein
MSEILAPIDGESIKKPYEPALFRHISELAQLNYTAVAGANTELFRVALPKGKLFETYLDNLPAEHRAQMDCSCCRGFLKRFGALVTISTEEGHAGEIKSVLWGDAAETDGRAGVFANSVKAMRELIEAAQIEHHFLSSLKVLGEPEKGGYEHFALTNANVFEHGTKKPHEIVAEEYQHYKNLSEFVGKTAQHVIDSAVAFFKNDGRLKTHANWVGHIEWLAAFKRQREPLEAKEKKAFTWFHIATQGYGRKNIYKGPVGTFIDNVIKGDTHEVATRKFLEMVKGTNFMRPKAAPKEGAVKRAETIFEKMELAPSLERRNLTHEELCCKIWSQPQPEVKPEEKASLFGHLKTHEEKREIKPVLPQVNHGTITLKRFLEEVLPEAQEIYFEYGHHYHTHKFNLSAYLTAVHADAKPILIWDKEDDRNPVSGYVYHGGSTPANWCLPAKEVRITNIVLDPQCWNKDETATKPFVFGAQNSMMFVLESGYDARLSGATPMFPQTFRSELHEVRSVMESFFASKALTPLVEGQQPVVGLIANTNGDNFLPLKVVKKDAIVHYVIDRSH